MKKTLKYRGTAALAAATVLIATGCGSDADNTVDSVENVASDSWSDVTSAVAAFNGHVENLPDDTQNAWNDLNSQVASLADSVKDASPSDDAKSAWAKVKSDADALQTKLDNAVDTINDDAKDAWNKFRDELDKLDSKF